MACVIYKSSEFPEKVVFYIKNKHVFLILQNTYAEIKPVTRKARIFFHLQKKMQMNFLLRM